jgi:integrase
MKLTAAFVKNVKAESKPKKYFDGNGMYLFVKPNSTPYGAKYWRFDFRNNGKYKTLGLGTYPDMSLADARIEREKARQIVKEGVDPSAQRKAIKAVKIGQSVNTFEIIAREWLVTQSLHWVLSHATRNTRRLECHIFPLFGAKPIIEITPKELLDALQRIERRGTIETAHRVKSLCDQIFDFAINTLRCTYNPAHPIRKSLQKAKTNHFATITDPIEVGKLLRAIDSYKCFFVTQCALKLAPLVFVRPNELRRAEWSEIDLDACVWTIPAEKMKMKRKHSVPLSTQATAILQELKPFTGNKQFCFPGLRTSKRPMSENTVLGALRRMGYGTEEMCGHGFRSMASTLLNEKGWNRDAIERQLAHCPRDEVRAAYNHAEYLPERREMMQAWANYLDILKNINN